MRNHHTLRNRNESKVRRTKTQLGLGSLVLALLFTLVVPAFSSALHLSNSVLGGGTAAAAGTYNGTAFRDFNADGVQSTQEPGLAGVVVTLYDNAGNVAGTAITDANGDYSISATGTGPYRVEFTLPGDPANTPGELIDFMRPGAAGGTTVQFVLDGGATVDVGFNNPGQYAPDEALPIAIAEHSSGFRRFINNPPNIDPTITTILETYGSDATFANSDSYREPAKGVLTDQDDTGGIWAMAYDRTNEVIYAGSFVRRFVPLKGNPTTIHRLDVSTGIVTDWITLDPTRQDPHGPNPIWTEDFDVINTVGREGIGGMKMAEDGSSLFAVDLGTRTLYSIPVNDDGSAGTPVAIDLVNGAGSPYSLVNNCTVASDFRPFGLGMRDGILYLGAVCSAESTANNTGLPTSSLNGTRVGDVDALVGYVFTFDGANWSLPMDFPLNYERGIINRQGLNSPWARTNPMNDARWAPWVYTYPFTYLLTPFDSRERIGHYPQPIISEIEFDNNGDMILGLMDRYALMDAAEAVRPNNQGSTIEPTAAGDILRACVTTPGSWVMEKLISGDTSCDTAGEISHNVPPNDTPLVPIDEYYYTDQYHGFNNLGPVPGAADMPNHSEVAQGALAQIPGRAFVISTVQDGNFNATLNFYRSGLHWYNNSDGSFLRAYEVRDEQMRTLGFWAKAGGLGDVEPLVPPAPLEIGNRVWVDSNSNGRQDPSEDGLADVIVELYREIPNVGLTKVAQTTTDAQGRYIFSFDTNANSPTPEDWSFSTDTSVLPKQQYEVRVNLTQAAISGPGYVITTQNSAAAGNDSSNNFNTDLRDSDGDNGVLNPNHSTIAYTTGRAGENNHTLDFGLRAKPPLFDWGDLPDGVAGSADYATLDANSGPFHFIDGFTFMGAGVDDEDDGQPNASATGDDANGTPDDEDGVTFGAPLIPGTTVPVTITTTTELGTGALSLFIDFNGDGDFADPGEVILSDEVVNDGVQVIQVTVPADAVNVFGVRARFTNGPQQGGGKPTGGAETGEVEDYILAALGDYVWLDDNKDGIQNEPLTNGVNNVTVELLDGQGNVLATTTTKNDSNGNPGYYQFPGLIPGTPYSVRFTAPAGYGFTTQTGTIDISNNSDADPATGTTVSVTLQPGEHNPNIDAGLVLLTFDRGDLPDGIAGSADYATLLANNGPSHIIDDTTFLGATVDAESDGQPNASATGDDINGTPDDEDGVTFGAPLIPGTTVAVTITTNTADGDGALSLFIDFNGDGDFADPGEVILSDSVVADGVQVVSVNVPATASG
ncbi:hypothetical protein GC175_10975, partial [bacterium]|nr:hypothetical protein [bacterium]